MGQAALTAAVLAFLSAAQAAGQNGPVDLTGKPRDPFATPARARVFLFVRTDCPISNRYAPELQRLAMAFVNRGVEFWLVYPDRSATSMAIADHLGKYHFPGEPLRDPGYDLVRRAHATITPEAAVFDSAGRLVYHGRIDDRWIEIGKSRPAPLTHDLEEAIAAVLANRPVPRPETPAVGCTLADIK